MEDAANLHLMIKSSEISKMKKKGMGFSGRENCGAARLASLSFPSSELALVRLASARTQSPRGFSNQCLRIMVS